MIISIILNVIFVILLIVSVFFNIKLSKFAMAFEDNVTECLDDLDERYRTITKILEMPIAYDSFEVRQVLTEIDEARNAILRSAKRIASKESTVNQENE